MSAKHIVLKDPHTVGIVSREAAYRLDATFAKTARQMILERANQLPVRPPVEEEAPSGDAA